MKIDTLQIFTTPWTLACQAPLSMKFSKQEYWSGLPFPSPGNLPDPGIKSRYPAMQADSLPSEPPGKPRYTLQLSNSVPRYISCKEVAIRLHSSIYSRKIKLE